MSTSTRPVAPDRDASGRGGYCFHLNGAFSELLRSLGYDVVRHVGGVHGPDGASARRDDATTSSSPSAGCRPTSNPDGGWYVDAGLGDALYEPLPLIAGAYDQGPFHLVLDATPGGVGDWHLTHDPAGGFPGMAWRADADGDRRVRRAERWLSTSPESGFVRVLTVQRRDATGVDVLRGLNLLRIGEGTSTRTLETQAELVEALDDFGFDVTAFDDGAMDALWTKVHRAHVEWEAAGRP